MKLNFYKFVYSMLRQHPLPCQTVRHPCFDCLHPCKGYICPILRDASHKKARSTGLVVLASQMTMKVAFIVTHTNINCVLAAKRTRFQFIFFHHDSPKSLVLLERHLNKLLCCIIVSNNRIRIFVKRNTSLRMLPRNIFNRLIAIQKTFQHTFKICRIIKYFCFHS